MNRRSFLATLCAVVVAPLVAVQPTLAIAPHPTFAHLIGQAVWCVNEDSQEVLRITGVSRGVVTYERAR